MIPRFVAAMQDILDLEQAARCAKPVIHMQLYLKHAPESHHTILRYALATRATPVVELLANLTHVAKGTLVVGSTVPRARSATPMPK